MERQHERDRDPDRGEGADPRQPDEQVVERRRPVVDDPPGEAVVDRRER